LTSRLIDLLRLFLWWYLMHSVKISDWAGWGWAYIPDFSVRSCTRSNIVSSSNVYSRESKKKMSTDPTPGSLCSHQMALQTRDNTSLGRVRSTYSDDTNGFSVGRSGLDGWLWFLWGWELAWRATHPSIFWRPIFPSFNSLVFLLLQHAATFPCLWSGDLHLLVYGIAICFVDIWYCDLHL